MGKIKNIIKKVVLCVSTGAFSCIVPMLTYATDDETAVDVDFLTNGGGSAFDKVNEQAQALGSSFNRLLSTIAVIVFLTSIAGVAFTLAYAKGQQKQEAKGSLLHVVLGIFLFFAGTSIIVLIAGIGKSAFAA